MIIPTLFLWPLLQKFPSRGKYTLSPSLDFSTNPTKGQFMSSFDSSKQVINDFQGNILSSKAGLLFNTHKYYIGYSVVILNHLSKNRNNPPGYLEGFRSYLQFGYTFQRSSESKFSFTPQFAFSLSEKRYPYDDVVGFDGINLNFRYTNFIAGLNDTGIHLGYQNEKMRFMLSSNIGNWIYPPTNLSFRYIFKQNDKNPSRF